MIIDITIDIDDEIKDKYFPGRSEVTLECEMDYEPADPSVGIKYESFGLFKVIDVKTGDEYFESDIPELWQQFRRQAEQSVKREAEEARLERRIQAYENQKYI